MVLYLIFILFVFIADNHVDSLSCKIKSGKSRFNPNWLIIYKPSISSLKNGYFYHKSNDVIGWNLNEEDIFNEDSTLTGIFNEIHQDQTQEKSKRRISYIHYDNKMLWMKKQKYSDLKGSLIWNGNSAIWIIHTLSKYSDRSSGKYRFDETGFRKAHLFLCITITTNDISLIYKYLSRAKIYIYDEFFVNKDKERRLKRNENEDENVSGPTRLGYSENLFGSGTTVLRIIVKGKKHNDFWKKARLELGNEKNFFIKSYSTLPSINYYVPNYYASNCKDVLGLVINHNLKGPITWKSDMDKSKFFMGHKGHKGNTGDTHFFCISDTNRYIPTYKHHGFALCIYDFNLYKTFENSIYISQKCDR